MFDKDLLPLVYNMNTTIMWIAVTVGVLLFIIGYFAGGREKMGRIILCTFTITIISVLGMRVPMLLFSAIKDNYKFVTLPQSEVDDYLKSKEATKATTKPADSATEKQATNNNDEDSTVDVPVAFQILTLFLYTFWIAFLVGMGIFFYETVIVTAEEIDKK